MINSLRRHVCASSYVRMRVLFCPKSYLFLLLTSTAFFAFSLYCQPCHLPIVPLPSRVGSRVLTLGFIQICSLRGWKVVMKAKKNSLALSLTTRLVLLMKPKENSIFCPCYSFPPILHLFPRSACILSFSISGASDSQTNSLSPSVLYKTLCENVTNITFLMWEPFCQMLTVIKSRYCYRKGLSRLCSIVGVNSNLKSLLFFIDVNFNSLKKYICNMWVCDLLHGSKASVLLQQLRRCQSQEGNNVNEVD